MRHHLYLDTLCLVILFSLIVTGFLGFEKAFTQSFAPITAGSALPEFSLEPPGSDAAKEYLGLKDSEPFSISDVSAKIVILEIFSFYCPHCRVQAPILNETYSFVQNDAELKRGIKMIGICAGVGKEKVDQWRATFKVPFPLFPDPDTSIWQKLGKPGVPCTLILDNSGKVLAAHYGAIEDIDKFFCEIRKLYKEQT